MSTSMKTGIFLLSLAAMFIYFTLTSGLSIYISEVMPKQAGYYLTNLIVMIGFLIMLFTQAAVRIFYSNKFLKKLTVLDTLPTGSTRFVDKLTVYALPTILTFIPVIRNKTIYPSDIATFISLIILLVIIEILFYLNSKTMKIYITNNGFVVKGLDIRLDTPLPSNYKNPSGYFPNERLQDFLDMNDSLVVRQSYDAGEIVIKSSRDQIKKIKGLLLANKVFERRR